MSDLYVNPHRSQYELGASLTTRHSGCTWTSGANGVAATTGGRYQPSPDKVHSLLQRSEETSPGTPGWSIPDLVKALGRYGVTLTNMTGAGFNAAVAQLEAGHYIVLQGDSDRFADSTCSGAFNGDHCIGVHPNTKVVDGVRWWRIDDPICREARWERETVLRAYAEKFDPHCRFAAFLAKVPPAVHHWRLLPGTYWDYTRPGGGKFVRRRRLTGGASGECDPPKLEVTPYGRKLLVKVRTGFLKGHWLDAKAWNVRVEG